MKEVVALLRGLRNGLYYGGRLRLIHALVMTLLFKPATPAALRGVGQVGFEHAWFLGRFVLAYKGLRLALRLALGPPRPWHCFLAGAGASLLLNRDKTSIKYQIVLYLFSRIVMACLSILYGCTRPKANAAADANNEQEEYERASERGFRVLATVCWGLVMLLYYSKRGHLQDTLAGSMDFLYEASERPVERWAQLVPVTLPEGLARALGGPKRQA
jgi:peroxisomal membrane protein 4